MRPSSYVGGNEAGFDWVTWREPTSFVQEGRSNYFWKDSRGSFSCPDMMGRLAHQKSWHLHSTTNTKMFDTTQPAKSIDEKETPEFHTRKTGSFSI
jgi:hypothetical protein